MKTEPKMQHCFYCGAELGIYAGWTDLRERCGSEECASEERETVRYQQEEAQYAAEMDGYSLYGGGY